MDASAHRSINYRAKALPRWVLRRVRRNEQAKIYRHFVGSFPPCPDWLLLEVGTNDSLTDPHAEQITATGLEEPDVFRSVSTRYTYVKVRRDAPLPFDDRSFDLVFSNAVVEHVGSRERQRRFLDRRIYAAASFRARGE